MEIKLICTWLRKKANSEFALTYKYFWKQKYPFSPKTQNPMGVFPKYTQHAAIQGTLCMFLCGRLLLCPCYFCQGQGDPVSVIWDEIARCSSCTFTSRKTLKKKKSVMSPQKPAQWHNNTTTQLLKKKKKKRSAFFSVKSPHLQLWNCRLEKLLILKTHTQSEKMSYLLICLHFDLAHCCV